MSAATKTFEYQVRDRGGKVVTGKLDAPNQAALVVKLKEMGYAPLAVIGEEVRRPERRDQPSRARTGSSSRTWRSCRGSSPR